MAGVTGALAVTCILGFLRASGKTEVNMEMALGQLIILHVGHGAAFSGFLFHLLAGGVFALLYEQVMVILGVKSWTFGIFLAVPHWIFGGIVMGQLCASHPAMQANMPGDEPFHSLVGISTLGVILAAHLIYGALVGFAISPPQDVDNKGSEELTDKATDLESSEIPDQRAA